MYESISEYQKKVRLWILLLIIMQSESEDPVFQTIFDLLDVITYNVVSCYTSYNIHLYVFYCKQDKKLQEQNNLLVKKVRK